MRESDRPGFRFGYYRLGRATRHGHRRLVTERLILPCGAMFLP